MYALKITPPGMDAAEAALCHTAITGGVAALLELLDNHTNLVIMSRDAIETSPNFTNKHPYFALHLSLSFAPYRALASLARFAERLQNI
ncbi:MAG: hypothetical protein E7616_06375 [Ruminococcaceae bacterium]|nr:hypothetical protein [Oscillospiraceae bacterium]